jgi:hypothetical protein
MLRYNCLLRMSVRALLDRLRPLPDPTPALPPILAELQAHPMYINGSSAARCRSGCVRPVICCTCGSSRQRPNCCC